MHPRPSGVQQCLAAGETEEAGREKPKPVGPVLEPGAAIPEATNQHEYVEHVT